MLPRHCKACCGSNGHAGEECNSACRHAITGCDVVYTRINMSVVSQQEQCMQLKQVG